MSRRGSTLELSILGDATEERRIQLEQNLQQTDLSLHLSSPRNDFSDIEHPRHISDPYSFSGAISFDRSREGFVSPTHQHWSYRGIEDDEGYNPYAGETISTAAHHASALTLSAGLGGRGARRDISLSGAEYDPDRPVQGIMAGMSRKGHGKPVGYSSKSIINPIATFDPLVVDDSTELDQFFPQSRRELSGLQSPPPSDGAPSPTTRDIVHSPRPKLSDALHRVTFSPKRPRSAQNTPSHRSARQTKRNEPSFTAQSTARDRTHQSLSYGAIRHSIPDEPAVNVHPPTPSQADGSSKFTRLAKGITAELQAESQARRIANEKLSTIPQSTMRKRPPVSAKPIQSPFKDGTAHMRNDGDRSHSKFPGSKSFSKSKVHLPDVTGLTSAIQSPSKLGMGYLVYEGQEEGERAAALMATLTVVQSKLAYLESENGISRRRVAELERELEACKKEVARERTRTYDQEYNAPAARTTVSAGNTSTSRYREVLEEKKALEELVASLQAHLARLTAELSEHKLLLAELRTLRDQDSAALQEKSTDISRLREEVERLSGEVEVLRGVVEEGLKERREIRERSMAETSGTTSQAHSEADLQERTAAPLHEEEASSVLSEDTTSPSRASTPTQRNPPPVTIEDEDDDTEPEASHNAGPYIDEEELDRISLEVEERRSERSMSRSIISPSRPREHKSYGARSPPRSPLAKPPITTTVPTQRSLQSTLGGTLRQPPHASSSAQTEAGPSQPRPDNHPDLRASKAGASEAEPFPQIRGTRMERLFFSAPQHDAQTCTLCHRRRRPSSRTASGSAKNYMGFYDADTPKEGHAEERYIPGTAAPSEDRLPPQTVLARVLRELEDDFTHYKAIYVELADQYKLIDAASNVAKRNVLAQHVREIIDILEQKGDQIASLYELLSFEDKALPTE
ncbi:hypothetical protein BXZ70DRAFT_1075478 [Cristinia sonorae]|uniref:Cep57 centrosome microtubule-binding domain-containing protein n=1 Tax=Cristinia sonorae TaxID=1940300 RepID=A0A8K0UVI3_9AGAR|nr:hypothetical protein BXZ70DRAFT_1075478 [Cristinia sonorae]